ncbi:prepilin peptidase [Oerskovia paurometabola]|uniref:prepilin peptidase n=1 Tax=Oerskovia paurometabola TaxID=162170 RepID=UPI0037F4A49F
MTNAGGGGPVVVPGQDGSVETSPDAGAPDLPDLATARRPVRIWRRAVAEVRPHRRAVLAVTAVAVPATVVGAWAAGHPVVVLPAAGYLALVGSALAVIDARTHRLPDALVLPSYPVLAVLLGLAGLLGPDGGALLRASAGGLGLYGAYFLLALAPSGLGFGDVKLAGLIGAMLAWCGWAELAVGASVAFFLGGSWALVLLATRRAGRRSAIPFGPFMLAGALVGLIGGPAVLDEALLLG